MRKAAYLSDQDVRDFVQWFATELTHPRLRHQYTTARGQHHLVFSGLPDAWAKYDWPFQVQVPGARQPCTGHAYSDNERVLKQLARGLRQSLSGSSSPVSVRAWSLAVLEWGRVTAHNASWVNRKGPRLAAILKRAVRRLRQCDDDVNTLGSAIPRFNAGFTSTRRIAESRRVRVAGLSPAAAWLARNNAIVSAVAGSGTRDRQGAARPRPAPLRLRRRVPALRGRGRQHLGPSRNARKASR